MKITDIHKIITNKFPLSKQEKWDQSGMALLPNKTAQVSGVMICLDLTDEIVQQAVKNEINFIISHHPIFTNSKEHKASDYELKLLKTLKEKKIAFASYHTNLDNAPEGMNYYVAKQLDLSQIKNIPGSGIITGRIGSAYRPKVFASYIKNTFDLERVLYTSDELVKTVAICSGAGFSMFVEHANALKGIDLLVTGDMKWHDWQYAKLHQMTVMDVGHDLENVFVEIITKLISNEVKIIKIQTIRNKQDIKVVI